VAPRARKSGNKMPQHYRERLAELISLLVRNPVPAEAYDVIKLGGRDDSYRIRIGGIRVSYSVAWERSEVHVYEVEWRGGAYK